MLAKRMKKLLAFVADRHNPRSGLNSKRSFLEEYKKKEGVEIDFGKRLQSYGNWVIMDKILWKLDLPLNGELGWKMSSFNQLFC